MHIEIRNYQSSDFLSLNQLLEEAFHLSKVKEEGSSNLEFVAIYENQVIGYFSIHPMIDSVLHTSYGYVNYVCVLEKFQHQGIAYEMFLKAISQCRKLGMTYLELTSNKSRVYAHQLYEKLGFQKRDTDVFRKEIL